MPILFGFLVFLFVYCESGGLKERGVKSLCVKAKAVGLRVSSFDGTTLIKTYDSISEAARNMVVNSNAIKRALKNPDGFTCKGLSWRYTPLSKDA